MHFVWVLLILSLAYRGTRKKAAFLWLMFKCSTVNQCVHIITLFYWWKWHETVDGLGQTRHNAWPFEWVRLTYSAQLNESQIHDPDIWYLSLGFVVSCDPFFIRVQFRFDPKFIEICARMARKNQQIQAHKMMNETNTLQDYDWAHSRPVIKSCNGISNFTAEW